MKNPCPNHEEHCQYKTSYHAQVEVIKELEDKNQKLFEIILEVIVQLASDPQSAKDRLNEMKDIS
jgi:predicted house-cleaning noncanonical NTP pyrophosphatase (MazG superfamily)